MRLLGLLIFCLALLWTALATADPCRQIEYAELQDIATGDLVRTYCEAGRMAEIEERHYVAFSKIAKNEQRHQDLDYLARQYDLTAAATLRAIDIREKNARGDGGFTAETERQFNAERITAVRKQKERYEKIIAEKQELLRALSEVQAEDADRGSADKAEQNWRGCTAMQARIITTLKKRGVSESPPCLAPSKNK